MSTIERTNELLLAALAADWVPITADDLSARHDLAYFDDEESGAVLYVARKETETLVRIVRRVHVQVVAYSDDGDHCDSVTINYELFQ